MGDVDLIHEFGETHIRPHYAPLIGTRAADSQVTRWWNEEQIATAVSDGRIVVADAGDLVVAVAQRGWNGADHVLYKLYVAPGIRGQGLGPWLIDAIVRQLPPDARRLCVEHFASNARAGAFYEREGFAVERVEPHPDDSALDVVWRARDISPGERGPL